MRILYAYFCGRQLNNRSFPQFFATFGYFFACLSIDREGVCHTPFPVSHWKSRQRYLPLDIYACYLQQIQAFPYSEKDIKKNAAPWNKGAAYPEKVQKICEKPWASRKLDSV